MCLELSIGRGYNVRRGYPGHTDRSINAIMIKYMLMYRSIEVNLSYLHLQIEWITGCCDLRPAHTLITCFGLGELNGQSAYSSP